MKMPTTRRGLSLIEVMISLSISTMVLTAVAGAFSASAAVIQHNDQFFRASQAARVSLNQMLREIRCAHAVRVPSSTRIDMIAADGNDRSYWYDAGNQQLKLVMNGGYSTGYRLADCVTGVNFAADTMQDSGGISHVVRVTVTLTVQVGSNKVRLSGSAAPRREQK